MACNLLLLRRFDRAYYSLGRIPAVRLVPTFGGQAVHILGWIVFGLIAGAIARALMPGRQPMGIILTIILGIVGSFVGGTIANLFRGIPITEPSPAGWIGSIVGGILVLLIYGMVAGRRTTV